MKLRNIILDKIPTFITIACSIYLAQILNMKLLNINIRYFVAFLFGSCLYFILVKIVSILRK